MRRLTHLFAAFTITTLACSTVFAQPSPFYMVKNTNLLFAASTLVTNGAPPLTNVPSRLTVAYVDPTTPNGGTVSLVSTQVWARLYDAFNGSDGGSKVLVDYLGNIIVAGSANNTIDFKNDAVTIKYNPNGTALWTNFYNGPANLGDSAGLGALDPAGNAYVCIYSENGSGGSDVITIKYSTNGTPVWTNRFSTDPTNQFVPLAIAVTTTNPAAPFVLITDTSSQLPSWILLKINPNTGVSPWTNVFRVTNSLAEFPQTVTVDSSGNPIIVGSSSIPGFAAFTAVKFTGNGVPLWTNLFPVFGSAYAFKAVVDPWDNVIISGTATTNSGPNYFQRYTTIKYSPAGVPLWTNSVPAPPNSNSPQVLSDRAGNIFLAGSTPIPDYNTNADFTFYKFNSNAVPIWTNRFFMPSYNREQMQVALDNGGNFYFATSTNRSFSTPDYITAKYSAAGAPVWTNRYNGTGDSYDVPSGIAVSDSGDVFVTGTSVGSSFDFGTLRYSQYIRYTPQTNFIGVDTFHFITYDYLGNSVVNLVTVVVQPPSLQFSIIPPAFQYTATGLKLRVDGARGTNGVIIFASTNTSDWQPIVTNPPVLGSVNYTDPPATNLSKRLYKASQVQ